MYSGERDVRSRGGSSRANLGVDPGDAVFTPAKTLRRQIVFPHIGNRAHNPNNQHTYSEANDDANASEYKRFIDRDGEFGQSKGSMSLRKKISAKLRRHLYSEDLFHSLVDMPTHKVIFLILGIYVALVFFFALIYWFIGVNYPECNMEIHTYTDGFGFSLQTAATIGYDTEDIFFGDCKLPLATILVQVCCKLLCDAFLIGQQFLL
jgi:hypothetical protein